MRTLSQRSALPDNSFSSSNLNELEKLIIAKQTNGGALPLFFELQ
jgi:hypothetical protein